MQNKVDVALCRGLFIGPYDLYLTLIETFVSLELCDSAAGLIEHAFNFYKLSNNDRAILLAMAGYNSFSKYSHSNRSEFLNEAENYFTMSIKYCPENIIVDYNHAYVQFKNGILESSEKEVSKILDKNPDYYPCYILLADIYTSLAENGDPGYYLRANQMLKKSLVPLSLYETDDKLLVRVYRQIVYNNLKYSAFYGYKNIDQSRLFDSYDYSYKALKINKNDLELQYLVSSLKDLKNRHNVEVGIRVFLVILALLAISFINYKFWKRHDIEISKYISLMIIMGLIIGACFWDVSKIESLGMSITIARNDASVIIPVEMAGIRKMEVSRLRK